MSKKQKKARLFSALEVANLCGVVNQTAINWIRNGYIKAFTTPGGQFRVYPEDLAEFLQKKGMRIPAEIYAAMGTEHAIESVLVVSADNRTLQNCTDVLTSWNPHTNIHLARTAWEAGRLSESSKSNLIIVHADFPEGLATRVIETFRSDTSLGLPWVIAIGNPSDESAKNAALEAGAHVWLDLPLDLQTFKEHNQALPRVVKRLGAEHEPSERDGESSNPAVL